MLFGMCKRWSMAIMQKYAKSIGQIYFLQPDLRLGLLIIKAKNTFRIKRRKSRFGLKKYFGHTF
jgi:hypothetical protein